MPQGSRQHPSSYCAVLVALALHAGAAGAAVLPLPGDAPTYVRKEINSWTAAEVDAYRLGVALMKSRPLEDPTSWAFQASMHGVPPSGSCPGEPPVELPDPAPIGWKTCQHRSFFFLPWHRMYLYYFERILRDAVREAVGDPAYPFALPYWNYSENPQLPAPFRLPADASNSLYVVSRRAACNQGQQCVAPHQAASEVALLTVPFCNCTPITAFCEGCQAFLPSALAFGSSHVSEQQQFGPGTGQLEQQPHNVVHSAVGGWMNSVDCSARDPIFYVHHANIDRLWQVWLNLGLGRANPLGSGDWKHDEFTFYDEEGRQVTLTGCAVVDMAGQLDYVYEGVPVQNVERCKTTTTTTAAAAAAAVAEPVLLAQSEPVDTLLGNSPTTVSVPLSETANQRILTVASSGTGRVLLSVDGIELLNHGGIFELYLDLPAGTAPDPEAVHFVGNLALFVGSHHLGEESRTYDITEEVTALQERGLWTNPLRVTFVRGTAPEAGDPEIFLSAGQISVVEQ